MKYCNLCKSSISEDVFDFSLQHFRRPLCISCQNKVKSSKNKAEPTIQEKRLFFALKKEGVPAKLQQFDGYKHIDIAIPEAHVNIEVDGSHHNKDHKQALADLKRTFYSFKKGYLTLRIPNSLVENHIDETVKYIVNFLNENMDQMDEDNFSFY